ncbi:MAG: PIN domain-containing protein [Terracidiphilus sp.]
MKLALDTNRYTDLCRGEAAVAAIVEQANEVWLYADEQTTHHYANVYRQLRKQGTPIPTNDMWIAALVLEHSLVLCARDAHFDALAQLARV